MVQPTSREATAAARGSVGLVSMQVLARLGGAVFAVVAARTLSPSDFGRYSTAAATVLLLGALADLGTTAALTRLVSRASLSPDELLGAAVPINVLLGCVAAALSVVVGASVYGSTGRVDLAIVSVALPLQSISTSIGGVLDGLNRLGLRAAIGTVSHVVQFGLGGIALVVTGDVRMALLAVPLSALALLVVSLVAVRRAGIWSLRVRYNRSAAGLLLRLAAPFALLGMISVVAARLDVVLVAWLADTEEAAVYDVSVRLVEAVGFLATAVGTPTLVVINRRRANGDSDGAQRAVSASARVLAVSGVTLSVISVGSARSLIAILGSDYQGAVAPLRILGSQIWLTFAVSLMGTVLMSSERIRRVVPVAAGITATTVSLDLALIPHWGAIGAASATVVATVVAALVFTMVSGRWGEPRVPWPPLPLLVAGGAAGYVGHLVDQSRLGALSLLVGPGLFGVAAVSLRSIRREDLRWILRNR